MSEEKNKKEEVVSDEPKAEAKAEVEEKVEPKKPKAAPKPKKIKLTAKFIQVNRDGTRERISVSSEGFNSEEALVNMTEVPQGINQLVTVIAEHDGNVIEKNVAPHIARALFDHKDDVEFDSRFRGL